MAAHNQCIKFGMSVSEGSFYVLKTKSCASIHTEVYYEEYPFSQQRDGAENNPLNPTYIPLPTI